MSDDVKHLPPLVIRKLKRSSGILRHVLGHGLPRRHVGMDTVVLTSSGKLTAFEPNGRFLWQVRNEYESKNADEGMSKLLSVNLHSTARITVNTHI